MCSFGLSLSLCLSLSFYLSLHLHLSLSLSPSLSISISLSLSCPHPYSLYSSIPPSHATSPCNSTYQWLFRFLFTLFLPFFLHTSPSRRELGWLMPTSGRCCGGNGVHSLPTRTFRLSTHRSVETV